MTKATEKRQVIKRLNPNLVAVTLCLTFFFFCFRYSLKINLWGDEAYSLQLATKSWQQIFTTFDVHLPTYYFFLKGLISVLGDSNEVVLRLVHSIIFSLGLFFGYKTILFLSKSPKKALLILTAAIISPTFLFYATNLRMYPLFFLFSMFYALRLSYILVKKELPTKRELIIYLAAAAGLVLIDFPGIVVFLVGSIMLFFKFFKLGRSKLIFLLTSPLILLSVYYLLLLPEIKNILAWKATVNAQIGLTKVSFFELIKWGYSVFRPVFDLFSSSQKSWILALLIPVLFVVGLFVSLALFLIKYKTRSSLTIVIVTSFAFYWLISNVSGHALTRAFLPALFFIPAFLILINSSLPKIVAKMNLVLFACLLLTNSFQTIMPTLKLYSVIPYKTIAQDTHQVAEKEKIKYIYFSDNSLNNLSIRRYLERTDPMLIETSLSVKNSSDVLTKEDFIFVSHMGENNNFINYQTIAEGFQVTNVKNYIKLADLPYNSFWKKQITDGAFQEYAVSVYTFKKYK